MKTYSRILSQSLLILGLSQPLLAAVEKDFVWYCESDEATEAQKATVDQVYKAAGADPEKLGCKEAFEAFNSSTLNLLFQGTATTDLAPLSGLTGVSYLACDNCSNTTVATIPELTSVKFLELSGSSLSSFPELKRLSKLQQLVFANNSAITTIGGSALPQSLEALSLHFTKVTDLNFLSQLAHINWLSIEAPPAGTLKTLPLLNGLKTLNASQLKDKDYSFLAQTPQLAELHLYTNGIVDISDIPLPKDLKALFLEFNNIREVAAGSLPKGLREFGIGYNPVRSLKHLAEAKDLNRLNFRGAGFKNWAELDPHLANLEFLDASENAFTVADIQASKVKSWPELKHLKLNDTNIKSLAFFKDIEAPKLDIATLPEIRGKNEENCPTTGVPKAVAAFCQLTADYR